jgi:PadR family transcriptional regulator AphA
MNYRIIDKNGKIYIELLPGTILKSENDAVETVGWCGESQTQLLMLHENNLAAEFFDLKTGLAGAILLKWVNYHVRAALVINPERLGQGKFYEFAIETNRGRQFYVANDRQEAEDWLLS